MGGQKHIQCPVCDLLELRVVILPSAVPKDPDPSEFDEERRKENLKLVGCRESQLR